MRILIVSVLVLVIAIGGWIVINKDSSDQESDTDIQVKVDEILPENDGDTTQSDEISNTLKVSYTSGGFSPSSLTVNAGDTVTFTNNGNSQMWVASNPHPIHTNLSAFDNRKGIASGEAYKFTFETAGEYFYHDHLNIGYGGTIIVK